MAFPAVAALIAAETVTATVVLAAVAEVGLAMTVVGAVTGSKTLMKIGGAMSLIGGVGGMIAGAASGAASAAAGAATEPVASAVADAAVESAAAGAGEAALGSQAADLAMQGAATEPVASMASSASEGSIFQSAMNPTDMRLAAGTQTSPGAQIQAELATGPSVADVATPGAPQAPNAPAGAQAPASPADFEVGGRYGPDNMDVGGGWSPTSGTAPQQSSSFFGKLGTWVKENPKLFASGAQLVGGAMQGANQRQMWDQKMALERQALAQKGHGNEVARWQPRSIFQGARA